MRPTLPALAAAALMLGPEAFAQPPATHQARMDAIRAFGEANSRAFDARMAAMDVSHRRALEALTGPAPAPALPAASDASNRRFINAIRGEHTVVTPTGQTLQVDNGHQRYFVDEATGRWAGGDAWSDARSLHLDPEAFVEARIRY